MKARHLPLLGLLFLSSFSFAITHTADSIVQAPIRILTDAEYPDNNAIGFRSSLIGTYTHNNVTFAEKSPGIFDITILPGNSLSDTIQLKSVNLLEMMPSAPDYLAKNNYLTYLSLLNQEWNRIQVRFNNTLYSIYGNGTEKNIISRVDVANNCLAKGDWEIILFTKENNNDVLYFQCWFQFPEKLYNKLFELRNGFSIAAYDDALKNYSKEPSQFIDLNSIRTITYETESQFQNLNDQLYPLKGERQTKAKNIIAPEIYTSINDFLNDNTKFATFASPGYYTRTQPRATHLSRFQSLNKVTFCKSISHNSKSSEGYELQLQFSDIAGNTTTRLVIGGLQLESLPKLSIDNMHKGWQRPMGFSNHSFYSDYSSIIENSSKDNPYFAVLLDENGKWLDSHDIGIDGPLMFVDENDPSKLHVMVLSFERHAFVGHYVIQIPSF